MKIIIKPNHDISEYNNIDGIILPLKEYAVDYTKYYSLREISNIKKNNKLEIFVVINRMFFNKDINKLANILKELDKININGIFFYDLAVLQLKKELDLKIDLVWNATFMVTNYETCNYYFDKGVKYAILSNELMEQEILEMQQKCKSTLMFYLIGYGVVANSHRHFIKNYNKAYNSNQKNGLEIEEKITKEKYLVYEDEFGTTFKESKIINHIDFLDKLKEVDFPYIILNEDLIEHSTFIKILDVITNNKDKEEIKKLIGNNTGFLNKKMIYKVIDR